MSVHSPFARLVSPTTDSVFPGEPVPTDPAARSATPVTRFASLAEPACCDLVAQFVSPRPHHSARRPPGGWIISLPNPLSPRELGWPSDPCDLPCRLPRCSAPFLELRLACAFRYSGSLLHLKIAGQAVFLKSQGYPQTFLTIPRSFSSVHVLHTGFAQRSH